LEWGVLVCKKFEHQVGNVEQNVEVLGLKDIETKKDFWHTNESMWDNGE
jgi:hypothetical protein